LSKDTLNHFEFVTFNPHNIKSHYFFLSRIVELLPNLTHLTIKKGETGLGEKGFKELVKGIARSSGSLEVLDMKYLGIDEVHVSKLAESHLTSEGLKTLILEGNLLGTDGSVKLSQLMIQHNSLPNLSELNLRCCRITDKGMEALAESFLVKRNLRKLDLSKNDATHVGLSKIVRNLAYNPRIEEVVLSELGRVSGRSEEMCVSLEKLFQLTVSLKTLNFWKTNVSQFINEKNMKRLAENSTLKVWDLGCVTGGAVEVLGLVLSSEVSKLEKLDLGSTSLDVGKCRRIYNRTKKKPSSITKLNLQNNSRFLNVSGAKDFELMVDFISVTFANVTHLDISNCNLVSDAAKVIADVLSRNTSLFHLDMSMNNIGKHGARFLATGLSQNTKLKVLRLDKNNIRSAGAHFLSSALSQPTCVLEELHLFSNFIDVPGTSAICSALSTNKQLKFIDLGLNKVRKRGAVAIIEMLSKNTSLNTLGLKFNYIPDSWAVKIVKQIVDVPLCKVNDIRLAGNSLQYETLISIVGLIKGADKDIKFDLYSRAQYLHPDRMEKTVYVSPIAANVTPEILKKLFYSKKCGAITSITIEKHRKRKASFAKANYAFIEFAHKDSVELAVDLMRHHEAHLGVGFQPSITRAGIGMTR
jgi:Ran GTPase-activating protein (RanGAP) involved in mRNA processing and transport